MEIRRTLHLDFSCRLDGIVGKIDEDKDVAKLRNDVTNAEEALSALANVLGLLLPAHAEECQQRLEGTLSSIKKVLQELVLKHHFTELINCGSDGL